MPRKSRTPKQKKTKEEQEELDDIRTIERGESSQNSEQLLRMNYLYQLSIKMMNLGGKDTNFTGVVNTKKHPTVKCPGLARFYLHELRKIGKKNVIRIHSDVKKLESMLVNDEVKKHPQCKHK
ncbi:unnamed protein product [Moneuplotes crassus]|uniref:Uncharacterized protein n=1 Tax=Euplotes crassus TaxID=5936 RepID=A0AAD1Y4H0_EUPCR|nr:unnamed protein product [Moneuplotes crassus]